MSAPAAVGIDRPTLRIRGTAYPVLLPTLRDPRLHLAAVIVSLQVLGQVAFEFRLSIAQILVSLLTAAILEVGIAFRRQHVIMWPASALLTGNGVAFILRVPGTEHGDWWSLDGAWIFAGTAAIALLSKYLIQFRGRHIFNPSNFGLVLCFLALGPERADPLEFWWGPMSPALAVALAIIVVGGLAILRRLHLTEIAVGFWLAFAAGIGVLAASGHSMTAAWHVGPIEGADFWWTLVSSPEILVFLFFMITDPRTIPAGRAGRRAYAVGVGLLATLLIAPQTTEFGTKVAILAALALVCAIRGAIEVVGSDRLTALAPRQPRRTVVGAVALAGAVIYGGFVVEAGFPARPEAGSPAALSGVQALPE
nr:RnfABCDGE type electron transport complex subunit D [Actinomycetota bacterium]